MFEFDENDAELEAFDALLTACLESANTNLPTWLYNGQDVWKMDLSQDTPVVVSEWSLETADVA